MNAKRIGGIVVIVVGVLVFLFGLYTKNRVHQVRQSINQGPSLFPNNPVDKGINQALENKIGEYDTPILFCLIGGGVLTAAGIAVIVFCGKKHRR